MRRISLARHWQRFLIPVLLAGATIVAGAAFAAGATPANDDATAVRLPGHALPLPAGAQRQSRGWVAALTDSRGAQPLTLSLVLRRDDEAGFQRYLAAVNDPASPQFHHFLDATQQAERFGPSVAAHAAVQAWLGSQGFALVDAPANRLTVSVRGTRAAAERAFGVQIDDFTLGERVFRANDTDPALPAAIAAHVQYVGGLSDLASPARPRAQRAAIRVAFSTTLCALWELAAGAAYKAGAGPGSSYNYYTQFLACFKAQQGKDAGQILAGTDPPAPAWQDANGAGQTVGLVQFDSYNPSDVADYIALLGLPASKLGDVTPVHVNGGAGAPGADQDEVLLDIDTVLNLAPGAAIRVYDAPFGGANASFQPILSRMLSDGVSIISNSWTYCEDQTSAADVTSIDSLLQSASVAGISVFSASGDSGSTCLDGATNTIGVPADSPHATAVGGTSLQQGPAYTYGSETWWNGSAATPPTGSGGYGSSRFFSRPTYQDSVSTGANRSIPDVATNADPAFGVQICNASEGGCPTSSLNGGTSRAAPAWAAYMALLNQTQGTNIGEFNLRAYALASSATFHDGASMGSDFAHVGLGSPKLAALHQALTAQSTGAVDAGVSRVWVYGDTNFVAYPLSANGLVRENDGNSTSIVRVKLTDAMGNFVAGKSVTLSANPGSHATITPASAVTNADGDALFNVTDSTAEALVLSARDTTDGITLTQTGGIDFQVAQATSASIVAFTDTEAADGQSADQITVTLTDTLGRPTPGKYVSLSQSGSAVISAPDPSVTDASGKIVFNVTDTVQEMVTFQAVDVSDFNLVVPGTAQVTFNAGGSDNCGTSRLTAGEIRAANGYAMTPYATGFLPKDTNFGGLTDGCRGASGLAFDSAGNLYVSDLHTGNVYKFPSGGGSAGAATLVTPTALGPGIEALAVGHDGKLYFAQNATTDNFTTGGVFELDPATGSVVRTLATLTCASFLAVDPASGDLFVDDSCSGSGSDNGSIWRIANPGSASPTTTVYGSTAGVNGGLAFADGGTLYVVDYTGTGLSSFSGTTSATPGTRTQLNGVVSPALDILALGTQANGGATTLVASTAATIGGLPAGMKLFDATTSPITPLAMLVENAYATVNLRGPDGCLYASLVTTVYRITNADGSCPLNALPPRLALDPPTVAGATQGSTQSFSVALQNTSAPAGTAVNLVVRGANTLQAVARLDGTGHASFTYPARKAGHDTVVAAITLAGGEIVSNSVDIDVAPGTHVTALVLSPNVLAGTAGGSASVAATLLDGSSTPTATIANQPVTFTLGSAHCSATTNASGVARCSIAVGAAGNVTLSAQFAGNASYLPASDSAGFTALAATAASTTTSLSATPNPVAQGQALTLVATVSAGTPQPTGNAKALLAAATGTVTFTDNGVTIGSAGLDGSGRATIVTASLALGSHPLMATYGGDAGDAPSSSATVTVVVTAAAPGGVLPAPALDLAGLLALCLGLGALAWRARRGVRA